MWFTKINPLLWKMFIRLECSLSLTSLVLNNITDGLLVKSLEDKSICYRGLFWFSSTMTSDHQGRGRKAIKGATAAPGYESKPLDLSTLPPADAKVLSLPPVPTSTSVESLSKLPALLTMFIR